MRSVAAMARERLTEEIRACINTIGDPCGLAQAVHVGIADMGLVTRLDIREAKDGRFDVALSLRVTAPGCMYAPYFERAVTAAVCALPVVADVAIEWDDDPDWSPADIAPAARARILNARRARTEAAH